MNEPSLAAANKDKQAPPLSDHYHKARKQLVLWSGILFAWEFIGIDLAALKESGGQVGPIIKAIKSPQAVPWVLLVMVFYFFYRTIIEWYQSDPLRRNLRVSKADMIVSMGCGMSAIFLYFIQRLLELQVADKIKPVFPYFLVGITVVTVANMGSFILAMRTRLSHAKIFFLHILALAVLSPLAILGLKKYPTLGVVFLLIIFASVFGYGVIFTPKARRINLDRNSDIPQLKQEE
jgi:hypothetical protein